ncbi:PTS system trehalose-specific EIIBC component [Bifidobacterium callitrichos]|uniref:PTS trehalose transporter subunit IIBC n=1 Tax=Bifidobacterium callitrichos DSM 23973 TaxID=1437609 RepID=A0A087A6S7_9BIFI|nr:PTS system trehalose-specific EIIBC component [Bifidobacterium callitrichos]KFI54477.1 PTS trehalose transporter subunit IIBC [Bifidobacterium callitrichos DSM 23973]
MGKYEGDARRLLDLVGGTANIKAVTHCMTRMRFVLVDPKQTDEPAIEEIASVKGIFTQAGQFQVIIGNDVAEFYKDFTAISGIEGVSKDEAKAAAKSNQNVAQKIMGTLGEIFAPIIPALICGGLILGFRNVIGEINFFTDSGAFDLANGTKSLADISQFWAGTYSFLWLIGEAVFHMLPVGICWSITRKMGTTQILGIVLGLTLVSPQLLNGFSVASTPAKDIPVWDFGFAKVQMIGYQGQVIAAMMAAFVLVYLERFFRKHCPEVVSMIVVPLCSLLPAVVIAHTIVGPIGWKIGDWIASAVYAGLFSPVRVLFAAVFGLLYAPVVMTGLHHMTNAIDTQLVTQYGGTALWPMIALSNIAQGSAVVGMAFLQKKNERAQQVNVPALISCYLGVTEPALFGVNLKYRFPLICGMIGSASAAMISVGLGVEATSIGVGGLPGILSIKPQFWGVFLLAMLTAVVVPFVLTVAVGRRKLTAVDRFGKEPAVAAVAEPVAVSGTAVAPVAAPAPASEPTADQSAAPTELTAILDGTVIPIDQVPDDVFSKRIVGDGVAFEPTGTTVLAPADATVSVVMADTGHACGLKLANGLELLIHVGIDTVSMGGDGFQLHVKAGDTVRRGDPLITFDPTKIKAAGHPTTTMLIVTGEGGAENVTMHSGFTAIAGETPVITWK